MAADEAISEHIGVYIRQRPLLQSDGDTAVGSGEGSSTSSSCVRQLAGDGSCSYYSATSKTTHQFKYDGCFDSDSTQVDVYERAAKPIVESALRGYSGTIFAYGPTNSGKTFTMRGTPGSENKGVMPRCIEQLLQATRANGGELWVSYLQIYCEIVSDLLNPAGIVDTSSSDSAAEPLQLSIREKAGRVFVEGLSRAPITNMQDLANILARGDANRSTAETNMNATSSRSHAALMVSVMMPEETTGKKAQQQPQTYRESLLVLVDLAGSERATASAGRQHARLEEAKAINLSLSALGNCMSALAECRKHVPYRDSKLTRLLQGSLGGGARTAVIVAVPPGADDTGEILNALRFASRASRVKVVAKVSRFVDYEAQYNDALRRLDEIEQQKASWQLKKGGTDELLAKHEEELESLREENAMLKRQLQLFYSSASALPAASVPAASSSASASASAASAEPLKSDATSADILRRQMATMGEKHAEDVAELKARHDRKVVLFKNQLADAQQEVSTLQGDLAAERQRHLTTVQELRKGQGQVAAVENTLGARIEELVSELDEKDGKLEDLIDMVKAQAARVQDLETRLLDARQGSQGMVPREKVTEMENLFMETVNRLSSRVMQLEAGKHDHAGESHLPPAAPNAARIQPGGRVLASASASNSSSAAVARGPMAALNANGKGFAR